MSSLCIDLVFLIFLDISNKDHCCVMITDEMWSHGNGQ